MFRGLAVVAIVVLSATPQNTVAAEKDTAPTAVEVTLHEMDWFVHELSLINLINGIHITRDQALKLRELARRIEAVATERPSSKGPLPAEWQRARKTYVELREVISAGKPVPKELEAKTTEARAVQTHWIRNGLLARPAGTDTRCANCHGEPSGDRAKSPKPMALGDVKQATDTAHYVADYGWLGLMLLTQLSPEVEKLLTEEQKAVFGKFDCCLCPPQDMDDPVRAGQAESTEKELELLRKVREIPAKKWAESRTAILTGVESVAEMVSPGIGAASKSARADKVGKILDRVRTLTDTEFEISKTELARSVKETIQPMPPASPHRPAYFLLIPGASKVYTRYLERLDSEAKQ
jgi:hypothetical protein